MRSAGIREGERKQREREREREKERGREREKVTQVRRWSKRKLLS